MKLRIKLFCHSIASDWNHGNAHFLRGVLTDLAVRGHDVESLEAEDAWSRSNLESERGVAAIEEFSRRYPRISWKTYHPERESVSELIDGADLVLVHEWNPPNLVKAIGEYRRNNPSTRVFFHDTHHRAVTAPHEMRLNDLAEYDAILVYGEALRQAYSKLGWTANVHVWHEAADIRVFKALKAATERGGLAWIGNWGDDERTQELDEFLMGPVASLGIAADAYGVRYPGEAVDRLRNAGIRYRGWLPNYEAPQVFANHKVTVHVPRRPYVLALPGIPTIRPFEAMACGIPLVCALWEDTESLFREGSDYLLARDGAEMKRMLRDVLNNPELAVSLASNGLSTIEKRHTCAHRVDELLDVYEMVRPNLTLIRSASPETTSNETSESELKICG
jgi:spore maturation protein CgeB